jgi:ABC-type branched-subunit amino acid transport system ATPase component/branched-subunit amino acid ABC-type transport system permease component
MAGLAPFLVIGLTTGSVYALAGIGLVLTYRTSRVFNFAHGSVAAVVVLLFYALVYRSGMAWQLSAILAILVIGPALGVALELLGRQLTPMATQAKVLATIGLILFISGAISLWGRYALGTNPSGSRPTLPGSLVRILGVNIGDDQIIIVAVGIAMTVLLHLVLERTIGGRAMRAVVENPELLAMTGRSPASARRAAWALGVGFVGLSGLLLVLAPSYSVSVGTLSLLVLQAFGAAAIGGFYSLPLTYFGGLAIGVASAVSTKYITETAFLNGLPPSIPFIILFLVLVAAPRHLAPEQTERPAVRHRPVWVVPRFWRWPIGSAVAAGLLIIGFSKNVRLVYSSNEGIAFAIVFLGLGLLIRTSGLVSLCQLGLAAVGASTFVQAADALGAPWPAAVILGGLAAAGVGAIVAIPAIRVAGIYLAVATFGFGVLLEQLVYPTALMFGTSDSTAPRPVIGPLNANNDVTYYAVLIALFAVAVVAVQMIRRARLGRLLRALGDSPVALQAQGTTINITRVAVFCLSAFLAGIGGALLISQYRFLQEGDFGSTNSLTIVVIVLTLGFGEPLASLAAAAAFVVVPSYLGNGNGPTWWLDIGFGSAAVLTALSGSLSWLPRLRWAVRPRRNPRPAPSRQGPRDRPPAVLQSTRLAEAPRPGLEIRNLSVRYRGVVAVEDLSLSAPLGQITGLIGPNGAGKTTTFNVCSGLVQPVSGQVLLKGRDISSLGPGARARLGLGRTFQRVDLFDSLTVRQNVELGREGAMAGSHLLTHVVATPSQMHDVRQAAADAIDLVGIVALAERATLSLSTSEKRLVELARCLAGGFELLLLDEPSSGLDEPGVRRFGEVLTRVVDDRGLGVLLVEHNVALVSAVCRALYVLDFGQLIFSGSPEAALHNNAVRTAYLGLDPVG